MKRTHLAAALVSVAPLRSTSQRQLHRPPRLSVPIGRQRTDRDQEAIAIGLWSVRIGSALEQHARVARVLLVDADRLHSERQL